MEKAPLPFFYVRDDMPRLTAAQAKRIWESLIADYALNTFIRLRRVKFGRGGAMKSDRYGAYAFHHFPNLIKEWKKRIKKTEEG